MVLSLFLTPPFLSLIDRHKINSSDLIVDTNISTMLSAKIPAIEYSRYM